MPRVARIVIPGRPHHVTQRGNNRQDVFFTDDDRRVYLDLLAQQADRHGLTVLAYCLMTNHLHLVAVPRSADSLARAVGRTHWLYARYVNRVYGRVGHLWQNRFYSCVLDGAGLWAAACYVEQNPVRAGLVRAAWRYEWSSASAHCGRPDDSGVLDLARWSRLRERFGPWQEVLRRRLTDAQVEAIRSRTHTGRPLGDDRFLAQLERALGRRVRPLPPGRPKAGRRSKK